MRYVRWAISVFFDRILRRAAAPGNFDRAVRIGYQTNSVDPGSKRRRTARIPNAARRDFTVKVDPKNGGSEHMAVVTEDNGAGRSNSRPSSSPCG